MHTTFVRTGLLIWVEYDRHWRDWLDKSFEYSSGTHLAFYHFMSQKFAEMFSFVWAHNCDCYAKLSLVEVSLPKLYNNHYRFQSRCTMYVLLWVGGYFLKTLSLVEGTLKASSFLASPSLSGWATFPSLFRYEPNMNSCDPDIMN